MWRYSMTEFGREVVALLDHLEVEEAVVMGTSLGANTTLEVAALAPERLRGMVIEMPVLDHALVGAAVAFTPLLLALTFGAPACARWRARRGSCPARRLRGRPTSSSTGSARTRAERRRRPGPVLRPHGRTGPSAARSRRRRW